jgi:hypothetical protein
VLEGIETSICQTSVEDFRKRESQIEKDFNRKVIATQEKSKEEIIRTLLENMTPKVTYGSLISNN